MKVLAWIAVLSIWGIGQAPPQDISTLTEQEKDVFGVYSTLMTNPPSSYGSRDPNSMYAIADQTRAIQSGLGNLVSCIQMPAEYNNRWDEINAQINSASDAPMTLKPALKITKPYALLNAAETRQMESFIGSKGSLSPIPPDPRFPGATSMFYLSNVYFDKAHSLALVQLNSFCGNLCGKGDSKIFEKTADGNWREVRPLRFCSVIA